MRNFLIIYRNFHWKGSDTIRTTYDIIFRSIIAEICQCSTYSNLDSFSHTFTYTYIMLAIHIFLNVCCQVISSNTDGVVRNYTPQRNHSNFSRTTTYIDNHVTFRCFHIHPNTNRSCHRLKDQIDIASTCMLCTITNSTEFHFGTTRRNTDNHTQ